MGNGAWGMEKSHQCPMPYALSRRAAIPLHPQGDGVSRRLPIKTLYTVKKMLETIGTRSHLKGVYVTGD